MAAVSAPTVYAAVVGRAGELAVHRGQRVERRRVVQRRRGSRRCAAHPCGSGRPVRSPGSSGWCWRAGRSPSCSEWTPSQPAEQRRRTRSAPPRSAHPAATTSTGPSTSPASPVSGPLPGSVPAVQSQAHRRRGTEDDGQRAERRPAVPRDAERAQRHDRQCHNAVGQQRARPQRRPARSAPVVRATIAPGHTNSNRAISTPNDKPTALVLAADVIRLARAVRPDPLPNACSSVRFTDVLRWLTWRTTLPGCGAAPVAGRRLGAPRRAERDAAAGFGGHHRLDRVPWLQADRHGSAPVGPAQRDGAGRGPAGDRRFRRAPIPRAWCSAPIGRCC